MTSSAPHRLPAGVALGGAVLVGVLTAIQARINGQLGLRIGDGFVAVLDMGWRDLGLAVEYDGAQHQTERAQYLKDRRRLPLLAERDWDVVAVVNEDRPRDVIARVYEAYLRRGGAEIDEMAWATRTFAPNRRFGQVRGAA